MKNYWKILKGHRYPGRFLAARLLMATGLCRLFTVDQRGYRIRFHNANLSCQLWIDPESRDAALALFRDYLKDGDYVVDVGANVGETALTSSVRVGKTGAVFAIEPHPKTFRHLTENVQLNSAINVTLINSAVGEAAGMVKFSDDRRDDMNRVGGGELEVMMERLDSLLPGGFEIALLKVDVEGYEKFVLGGAPGTLLRAKCVFIEVSAAHFRQYGYETRDVLEILLRSGFQLFRIVGSDCLTAVTAGYDTERYENLVGIRDVREFQDRTGWKICAS